MSALDLILLRHAHAEGDSPSGRDYDRPLSSHGLKQAEAAGEWLREKQIEPRQIVCSPARRTEQTLSVVAGALGSPPIRFEPRVYEATPGDLLKILEPFRGAGSVLLVGHNPGLEGLVALLATGRLGGHRGMPTSAIARLQVEADTPLEPGMATLGDLWWP